MLRYRFVPKRDLTPGADEDAKLYFPQLVPGGRVSFDDLCDEVAEESSLTSGDIKNCLDRFRHCLEKHLLEGRVVELGELGTFRVNLRGTGVSSTEDFDPRQMMRPPSVQYWMGKRLRHTIRKKAQFEHVKEKSRKVRSKP